MFAGGHGAGGIKMRNAMNKKTMTLAVLLLAALTGCNFTHLKYDLGLSDKPSDTPSGQVTYTVFYNANGGDGIAPTQNPVPADGTVEERTITLASPEPDPDNDYPGLTWPGHSFLGWLTAEGTMQPGDEYIVTNNTVFYAQWTGKYTVVFEPNGATSGAAPIIEPIAAGESVSLPDQGILEKTGYTFAGWNTQKQGGGTLYPAADLPTTAPFSSFTPVNDAITLYAQWTPKQYIVYFVENEGGTPSQASMTVTYGQSYGTLASVSRSGYQFDGWFTDSSGGTEITPDTTVSRPENHTLYAHWTKLYTVTYTAPGVTGAGNLPTEGSLGAGTRITVRSGDGLTKESYKFNGWNWNDNRYSPGDTITVNSDITFTAAWAEISLYTVFYNANGGVGTVPTQDAVNGGATITLKSPTGLSRSLYHFTGWFINEETYSPGVEYTVDGDTTITAQWEFNSLTGQTGPGGGIVYYSSEAGFDGQDGNTYHYLEVAPEDIECESGGWFWEDIVDEYYDIFDVHEWEYCANAIDVYNRDATEDFDNYNQNSQLGAKSDWRLPSIDELGLIWTYQENASEENRIPGLGPRNNENFVKGHPDHYKNYNVGMYWSSTPAPDRVEYNEEGTPVPVERAWARNLSGETIGADPNWNDPGVAPGAEQAFDKTNKFRVRPVRYVTDEEAAALWHDLLSGE
jgi:uncharacterized repeat protein (TIGR02543 family)